MLQDFNEKEVLEKIRRLEELKKQYKLMQDKRENIWTTLNYKENVKERLGRENNQALAIKEESNILSKIASIFGKGKYYDALRVIQDKRQELINIEEEIKALISEKKKIGEALEEIKKEISSIEIIRGIESVRNYDGKVIISEINGMDRTIRETSEIKPEETVIVHCTNFFPRENTILSSYAGGKIVEGQIRYRGVIKNLHTLNHREEVHCTLNNRVENTGDGNGKWNDPSYIIVDRFDEHQDDIEEVCTSDSWTKGTNIKLSKDAVIMVRLQDRDKLPISKEEMGKYNIIYYDGSPTACLRNFLTLNNYDILKTDPNAAGHAHSLRMKQETVLDIRDIIINCIMDDTWFSKEQPVFSSEDISKIMDVVVNSNNKFNIIDKSQVEAKLTDIDEAKREDYMKVFEFVYATGLKKGIDGTYIFGNNEEVLDNIKSMCAPKNGELVSDSQKISLIDELFKMQEEYALKYENMPIPTNEEMGSIKLDELYKFENQLACESIRKTLPSLFTMTVRKGKFKLCKTFFDVPNMDKKVKQADNIELVLYGSDGQVSREYGANFSGADIGTLTKELEDKFVEINGRTVREVGIDR